VSGIVNDMLIYFGVFYSV